MYISELELLGFKSFAYKTRIRFDSGITAIVGPNGCGKSNIVDSMRWVLGEQRPTLLRSASMSNVIFNGTSKKNALGMAEVSLTFVNNRGLLPTEYSEVTIARRLYRSGESEYLINGTTCRLKDIAELFMDTGMSSDAYSVIELKMVEEILNDKNNDRRRLFEEAAGITRYKEQRKKTFRKLDETEKDLQRLEDILMEVRKKTKSLERQAEKALAAKEYREELVLLDKALHRFEFETIQEELKPLRERISNADREKKEILAKAEELDQAEEKARGLLAEREREQGEAQRRVSQLQSSIRETDTGLQITREKISNEKNVIEQYARDIEQGEQDLEELRELFEQARKKLESFSGELEKAAHNLKDSKERYSDIQKKYSEEQAALQKLEQEYARTEEARNELHTRRIRIESRLENTGGDLSRIAGETAALEERIQELEEEKKLHTRQLEKISGNRQAAEEQLAAARSRREELTGIRDELKDRIRKEQSVLDSVRSEITLMEDLASSNEAFPSSVQFLMEEHANRFRMLDVVSSLLSTDQDHAVALEAALGESLNFVVVSNMEEARKAVDLLQKHDRGTATFIPLDRLSDTYETAEGSLYEQVRVEKPHRALAQLLVGHIRLLDSVEDAAGQLSGPRAVGVTRDGEVVSSDSFLKSGSRSKNAGVRVGLADRIEKLEKRAASLEAAIASLKEELEQSVKQREKIDLPLLEKQLGEQNREFRSVENAINSIESRTQVYEKNIAELQNRKKACAENEEQSHDELKKLEPEQEKLQKTLEDLRSRQGKKKQALQELEEERSIAQGRYNDARLRHQDLQNKVENHEKEIRRAEGGIASLKERLRRRSEKSAESRKKIDDHAAAIGEQEKHLGELKEQKKEADETLAEMEKASAKQRGRIHELEKELREIRRRKEVNMELVHHLAMAREKFEMQAQNLADHIWETYDMLMDQIGVELPEDRKPDEVRERLSWLRQKLNGIGEVNPLAIEEFEEEKERLDFYEEQIADLRKAEEELRQTIEEINKTATGRFNDTFEKIRVNFRQVFHTLFNEDDYCDLVIDEEAEDPLDASIEIRANPKGKRPSTINQLSGGEKTLTAIALLFAIYLVKPSPFCVLDEVDAPLDDANIERFAKMIRQFSEQTQFIIITHNKKTMSKAEMMYGITMPETGISRLVGVKLDDVAEA